MNLLRCKTCGKILTSEEIRNHNFCNVEIKNWKTIQASYISTLTNDEGENCVMVTGLDGVSYRIIEKKPNLVEYQPIGNTHKNNQQGNSTISKRTIYKSKKISLYTID